MQVIAENSNIVNNGAITLGNASSITTPNIALYSKTNNSITNTAMVKVGNNSIGLYGYAINNTGDITVGEKGSAIYSQGGNVKYYFWNNKCWKKWGSWSLHSW